MRPPRIRGFEYRGTYAYSLTMCTFQRAPHFTAAGEIDLVRLEILANAARYAFDVCAYCFMPDHLHLMVRGMKADATLTPFITMAKQRTGYLFCRRTGARLWQEGYFERTIRSDEDLTAVALYIQANPVRAGLVSRVADWPYTGGRLLESSGRSRPGFSRLAGLKARPTVGSDVVRGTYDLNEFPVRARHPAQPGSRNHSRGRPA
jgi:putative transposase